MKEENDDSDDDPYETPPQTINTDSESEYDANFNTPENSNNDSYETPPETINTDSEPEYDDNSNAPENSGDEFENDSELEEFVINSKRHSNGAS